MSERDGVEIDYCPSCRGVWLDRGELDKIIERAQSSGPSAYADDDEGFGKATGRDPRQRERENPIADLFDFF